MSIGSRASSASVHTTQEIVYSGGAVMRSARTILLIKAHQPDFYTSYDVTVRNVAGHDQHVDVNICIRTYVRVKREEQTGYCLSCILISHVSAL